MQLEFSYSNGMVRIKDVETPNIPAALDFSAPAGAFYSVLSDGGNPATDTMTIWHEHGALAIVSFKAADCSVPAGADFSTLKPLIDAILSQGSPTPSSMTATGTVYVSAIYGSPTGNGSLADPINTITDALVLADTYSQADGLAWGVHVLTGQYDEQIAIPAIPVPIWITLGSGAEVIFSGLGSTVNASGGDGYITMEQGSLLANSGGGSVLYPDSNSLTVFGDGTLRMDSVYPIVEIDLPGTVTLKGVTLLNVTPGNTVEVIRQLDGTFRAVEVPCISIVANSPIVKEGGAMLLADYRSYAPTATNYAESTTPQDIQIVNCVSNLAANVNITETVGTMLVDAAFQI